jgi:thiol-disulfide isomerase/thioredoxin
MRTRQSRFAPYLASAFAAAIGLTAAAAHARTLKEINTDFAAVEKQWEEQVRFPTGSLFNPLFKHQMAPVCTAMTKQKRDLVVEAMAADPKSPAKYRVNLMKYNAELSYFGDETGTKQLADMAAASDPAQAEAGTVGQQMAAWWDAGADVDARKEAFEKVAALAKANPASDPVADGLIMMLNTFPDDVETGKKINEIVCNEMKCPAAKAYAASPLKLDAPFAVDGTTLKNESWKLDKYKGKVVLVDFWATWCPPCREEIPKVAKLYADNHDKGFEIIGVTCDNDRGELMSFLKEHPEMPWTELFHPGTGWHPLTKKFNIHGIPTMYLVDRNGLLRSTEAIQSKEELVPKLLEEPYAPAPAPVKPTAAKAGGKPLAKTIGE